MCHVYISHRTVVAGLGEFRIRVGFRVTTFALHALSPKQSKTKSQNKRDKLGKTGLDEALVATMTTSWLVCNEGSVYGFMHSARVEGLQHYRAHASSLDNNGGSCT